MEAIKGQFTLNLILCLLQFVCGKESCEDALVIANRPYSKKIMSTIQEIFSNVTVQPKKHFRKDLTDVFLWADDDDIIVNKTIEDVINEIILESAFHVNGTLYVTTNYGIYKYDLLAESLNLVAIEANVTREYQQLKVMKDYYVMVDHQHRLKYFSREGLKFDCLPHLLTGYHLAVDSHCRVYYLWTAQEIDLNIWLSDRVSRVTMVAPLNTTRIPTIIIDYKKRTVYDTYDHGFSFREYNSLLTLQTSTDMKSEVLAMGLDALGNIFIIGLTNKVDYNIYAITPLHISCPANETHYAKVDTKSLVRTPRDEHEDPKYIVSNNECQNKIDGFKNYPELYSYVNEKTSTSIYRRNIYDIKNFQKQETKDKKDELKIKETTIIYTVTSVLVVCAVFLITSLKLYSVYRNKYNDVLVFEMERLRTGDLGTNADVAYSENSVYNALVYGCPPYDQFYSDGTLNSPTIYEGTFRSVDDYDNSTIYDDAPIHNPDITSGGVIVRENSIYKTSATERSVKGNIEENDSPTKDANANNSIYNISSPNGIISDIYDYPTNVANANSSIYNLSSPIGTISNTYDNPTNGAIANNSICNLSSLGGTISGNDDYNGAITNNSIYNSPDEIVGDTYDNPINGAIANNFIYDISSPDEIVSDTYDNPTNSAIAINPIYNLSSADEIADTYDNPTNGAIIAINSIYNLSSPGGTISGGNDDYNSAIANNSIYNLSSPDEIVFDTYDNPTNGAIANNSIYNLSSPDEIISDINDNPTNGVIAINSIYNLSSPDGTMSDNCDTNGAIANISVYKLSSLDSNISDT